MSATRRKGSRGGRAASRAGGPPATNALTWAESLAAGEPAPGASALEWAEGLAESEQAPSPWSGGGSGAAAGLAADPASTGEGGSSPWGPASSPVVADDGRDGAGDANPWGLVAATEPPVTRGRSKDAGGRGGKSKGKVAKSGTKGAPKTDLAPTPAGGSTLNARPETDDAPSGPVSDDVPPAPPDTSGSDQDELGSDEAGAQRGRGRAAGPGAARQRRIRRTLRRDLPRVLDKPVVLVLAGVTAAVLGLGTGWGLSLAHDDGALSSADAASCAQVQMAWTQAANAQSAMVGDQPETLRKGFINARNALEGVTPPEAIAEDWAIAFTYYSTVANNIEKVKPNDGAAVSSAVGGAQEELDTEAMVDASKRVQEYVASNCRG